MATQGQRQMSRLLGQELLAAWEDAQAAGKTLQEFADENGYTYSGLRGRLRRARENRQGTPTGKIKQEIQGNYLSIESGFSRRILTLDDLLKASNVDLETWEVERYIINKWEVGAKTAKRHIVWEAGQIVEGELDDSGELTIEPLIQVKAWLVRKEPIAIKPTIQPVIITPSIGSAGYVVSESPMGGGGWKTALLIPDIQFGFRRNMDTGKLDPYHSRQALDVVLQVSRSIRFDDMIFLGDILDLAEWSDRFVRSPDFYFTTQAAIVEAAWWLAQFRSSQPDAKMIIIEGNHDKRMADALPIHLAAAYNLRPATEIALPPALSIPRLLGLDSIGAEWVGDYPNGAAWLNDRLAVVHGEIARSGPGATAAAMIEGASHSIVFGHIHRIERVSRSVNGRNDSKSILAASPGCLCRLDYVVPGHTKGVGMAGWQNGFGVAHYHPGGDHAVELYQIMDAQVIYSGVVYQAIDRVDEIRRDTGWGF